jgi:hypothetical protein
MGNVPGNLVQNELPGNYKTQRLKVPNKKGKKALGRARKTFEISGHAVKGW